MKQILKKNNIYKLISAIFYAILCAVLWLLVFNPILLQFVSVEELYMPDVRGMYESDAIGLLKDKGFSVEIEYIGYDKGADPYTVFSMFPRAYSKVKKNRVIELMVYNDKEIIEVPDYTGLDLRDVKNKVRSDNLKVSDEDIFYYFDEFDPPGQISRQSPREGEFIEEGSRMSFWVSSGKPPNEYIVPYIIGKSFNEAKRELSINGFIIGDISYIENNDYLENTVYDLSYISQKGYSVEVLEGIKYTVPIRINLTLTKYGE